jgi:phosphate transport system substrate-binding protein
MPHCVISVRSSALILFVLLLTVMILAAGCKSGPSNGSEDGLSGEINVDGSSTVFPITEAVAEEFWREHSDVRVNVGISGTGGGFKRFISGETEISDASRPIKDSEAEIATRNGIEYYEFRVALDGLSVVVSASNDFVSCLTVEELKRIWEPGTVFEGKITNNPITNWNLVRDTFPDKSLNLYGPDTDSGTFDYFTEVIVGEIQASRSDYTASADDNVLVQGISGDRNGLGYFGYAYYEENRELLNVIDVDSGTGCVTPTLQTIEGGEYEPLSRPMFIYVRKDSLQRPEVAAFVEFYMEHGAELASEVGYIPLPAEEYVENLQRIQEAQ